MALQLHLRSGANGGLGASLLHRSLHPHGLLVVLVLQLLVTCLQRNLLGQHLLQGGWAASSLQLAPIRRLVKSQGGTTSCSQLQCCLPDTCALH